MNALESILAQALESAPTVFISVAGIYITVRMLIQAWAKNEDRRANIMDTRHKEYFEQLAQSHSSMVQAMDRSTHALDASTSVIADNNAILRNLQRERLHQQ